MNNGKQLDTSVIIKKLYEEYKEVNEKVESLNLGGCGVFAAFLFNALLKLNLNPKLRVLTNNKRNMEKRILKIPYNGYAALVHVVVKVGKLYVDSEGIYNNAYEIGKKHGYEPFERKLATTLTIERLEEWNGMEMWNPDFDRKQIKTVEEIINKAYSRINKNLLTNPLYFEDNFVSLI